MRQRIKLAQAMVHDPELLVLDEPLNGVDPVGRSDLAALFSRLGKAILVSSHVLEDMDRLADRVLFICRGRILACGSLSEIRRMLDGHPLRVCITADRPRPLAARLLESEFVQAVELEEGGKLVVQARSPQSFFELLTTLAVDEGFEIRRLEVTDASTQAVFDYLMSPAT